MSRDCGAAFILRERCVALSSHGRRMLRFSEACGFSDRPLLTSHVRLYGVILNEPAVTRAVVRDLLLFWFWCHP
jgi:hypothetical protein